MHVTIHTFTPCKVPTCSLGGVSYSFTHQWCSLREHFWVQYLAHGHFDMLTGGAEDRTADLPISARPTVLLIHSRSPEGADMFIITLEDVQIRLYLYI